MAESFRSRAPAVAAAARAAAITTAAAAARAAAITLAAALTTAAAITLAAILALSAPLVRATPANAATPANTATPANAATPVAPASPPTSVGSEPLVNGHIPAPAPPVTLPLTSKHQSAYVSPLLPVASGAGFAVALILMATQFALTRPRRYARNGRTL